MKTITSIWVGALIALSLQPLHPSPTSALHHFHRPFHFVAFALTALLFCRYFSTVFRIFPAVPSWLIALLTAVLIGLSLEFVQHLIYHNAMEWWDVRDDTIAAVLGVLLAQTFNQVVFPTIDSD
jgi:hypothetical protein